MSLKYRILNRNVEIRLNSEFVDFESELNRYFKYYDSFVGEANLEINVCAYNEVRRKIGDGSNNPSSHCSVENGFFIDYRKFGVFYFKEEDKYAFSIGLKSEGGTFISYLKKLNNIQYSSLVERIPQIIWELCIYPYLFFIDDMTMIHSSGFSYDDKFAFLLGGTGGCGKTTLEIMFSENEKFKLLNDDIAFLGQNGVVEPNFAFPKIYSYNLKNDRGLSKKLLENRKFHDRLAWYFKKQAFGENRVRRTIEPDALFGAVPEKGMPLRYYVYLNRGNYPALTLRAAKESRKIAALNVDIVLNEFYEFENHARWHNYNSFLNGYNPIVQLENQRNIWIEMQTKVFERVDCYILDIPVTMEHEAFKRGAYKLLNTLVTNEGN